VTGETSGTISGTIVVRGQWTLADLCQTGRRA